jgi:SAM-dependent methyltransferase
MNRLMRVNVETSSYYALPRFLCEVERVLRPGGFLLYADVRYGWGPPW